MSDKCLCLGKRYVMSVVINESESLLSVGIDLE